MDAISFSLIIIALVNSVLCFILLFNGKGARLAGLYAVNVVMILAWVWSIFFYRITENTNLFFWTQVLYSAATLIASSFLYFTYEFPKKEKGLSLLKALVIFVPNAALIALIFGTRLIVSNTVPVFGHEHAITFGPAYLIYVVYILLYFNYGYFRLFRKYRRTSNQVERAQILYLLFGYVSASGIAFATNLIMPWFGYFALNWVGQVSSVLMVTFATYAIFKYRLFNVRIITTQLFVFALWTFIFIRVLFANTFEDQIINGGLLVATIIAGILLMRSVVREVENREQVERLAQDLKKVNVRLKELDRQKSEFVSLASHQLRGPLTAIKGYASLILEGSYGTLTDELRKPIDNIFQSSQMLALTVEDFLDVSRIEQGRMKYDLSVFDMKDLVTRVIEELKPNAEHANLELTCTFDSNETYKIKADIGKMKQVVSNLIDNSIKYTPKGYVKAALTKDPKKKTILLSVSDSGIGVSKQVIPTLFQKFIRAKNANEVNVSGTGLGLYVVKQIVEAHEGRVWIESKGEGFGSTFWVELKEERA